MLGPFTKVNRSITNLLNYTIPFLHNIKRLLFTGNDLFSLSNYRRNKKTNQKVFERNGYFLLLSFRFCLSFVQLVMNVVAVLPESVPCCTHTQIHIHKDTHTLSFTVMLSYCPSQIKFDILLVSVLCIYDTHTLRPICLRMSRDAYYECDSSGKRYTAATWANTVCRIFYLIRVFGSILRYCNTNHSVSFHNLNTKKRKFSLLEDEILNQIFSKMHFCFSFSFVDKCNITIIKLAAYHQFDISCNLRRNKTEYIYSSIGVLMSAQDLIKFDWIARMYLDSIY